MHVHTHGHTHTLYIILTSSTCKLVPTWKAVLNWTIQLIIRKCQPEAQGTKKKTNQKKRRDQQSRSADSTLWPGQKKKSLFIYMEGSQLAVFHTMRPWHRLMDIHALAAAGISSFLNLCKRSSDARWSILGWNAWVPREGLDEHDSFLFQHSSGEVIFGQCFTRHQAQWREIPHSWKKWVHDTSDTVWGPAARDRC